MERLKFSSPISYSIQEEPIILSKGLLDLLLTDPHPADVIGLYCFYYYTAKWQKTNQIKATTSYAATALQWSQEKLRNVKGRLEELGLISNITNRGIGNKITGHYIRVNFIWSQKIHPTGNPYGGSIHTVDDTDPNALSDNNKNALNTNNVNAKAEIFIVPKLFEDFWSIYPKHTDKGKAYTAWNKICKRKTDRPTWREIRKAIHRQIDSKRWQNPKYIPYPATWLNQSRWLDDPTQMRETDYNNEEEYYEETRPEWLVRKENERKNK